MNDAPGLWLSLAAGGMLGAIFFGGLWWTVRRSLVSTQPALLLVGSLLLRMAMVVPGFIYVSDGRWPRMLACLAGFVIARFLVIRRTRITPQVASTPAAGEGHAAQSR